MKPHRVIRHRKQSQPARHTNAAPFGCVGKRRMSIEPNPLRSPEGASLIVERCDACGRILDVRGVLPAPELVNDADDAGDNQPWGV